MLPPTHGAMGVRLIRFRDNLLKMEGYVPGEQPQPGSRVVKLNTNENPSPPSPEVIKVLRGFEGEWLRRYPDPAATMTRESAARIDETPVDWIMATNGSDETLSLLARAFLKPGGRSHTQRRHTRYTSTWPRYRTPRGWKSPTTRSTGSR